MLVDKRVTKPSVIYAIQCSENGKVYIGRTQNLSRRIKQHWQEKAYEARLMDTSDKKLGVVRSQFVQDFHKYGKDGFLIYVIEEDVSPETCDDREKFWINEYNSTDPRFGYNRNGKSQFDGIENLMLGVPKNISKEKLIPKDIHPAD